MPRDLHSGEQGWLLLHYRTIMKGEMMKQNKQYRQNNQRGGC